MSVHQSSHYNNNVFIHRPSVQNEFCQKFWLPINHPSIMSIINAVIYLSTLLSYIPECTNHLLLASQSSTDPSVQPSIHSPTHLLIIISIIYPYVPLPTHMAMNASLIMLLFIHPSMRPSSIHPSVHCPSMHASVPSSFLYLSTANPFIFHLSLGAVPDGGDTLVETKPPRSQLQNLPSEAEPSQAARQKSCFRRSLRSLATTHDQKACGDKWQVTWSIAPPCQAVVQQAPQAQK